MPAADDLGMTTAPKHDLPTAPCDDAAVADVTTLLPSRDALLERLGERLTVTVRTSATLVIIGLLRRDEGWPTAQSTLAAVTGLLARSLRGDDYLAKSGPGEFAVLMSGPADAAEPAATRLSAAISDLGIEGLTAAAGIAQLAPELSAEEVLRRGLVSLTAARRAGAGTVIRYREPY
ncbi:GGDEF domain-containing protein [Blastococcus sp. PRF04-17]|uniref:GGDEF domain-containing protein n=1 Tax=Blastococcus sp. PRF04-17 TaxID=2933797 RepID=UPI001FF200FB|nr:diguanylate cyclase [Blastococcus sp. PRF04-17]UOY03820.1 diguanylate cyclase [Blastococcus sp. PRF04-17]